MLTLYRGDPQKGGMVVGYFDNVAEAQCAIHEDSRMHEEGDSYYLIEDEDEKA